MKKQKLQNWVTNHNAVKAYNFEHIENYGPFLCKIHSFFGWIMCQKWTEPSWQMLNLHFIKFPVGRVLMKANPIEIVHSLR